MTFSSFLNSPKISPMAVEWHMQCLLGDMSTIVSFYNPNNFYDWALQAIGSPLIINVYPEFAEEQTNALNTGHISKFVCLK